jgi:CHASE3 domain sensor protein
MSQTALQIFRQLLHRGRLRSVGTQFMIMSAVLLAASILMLWVSYGHLQHSFEIDERTDEALLLIDEVEAKLVGVEMTVRGFALTGEPTFLQWGARDRRDLEADMVKLEASMALEPQQKPRFAEMRALVRQRLDLYAYLGGHKDEVAHAIVDPKTRDVMHQARQRLAGLRKAQISLLAVRQAEMATRARSTLFLTTGIVIFAFLSVVTGIVLARGGDVKPEL